MSKISDISDIFLFNLTTNLKTFNLQPDRYDTVLYRYPWFICWLYYSIKYLCFVITILLE